MDLRDYIRKLSQSGLLTQLDVPVSCDLELPALCRREFQKKSGGKALIFQNLVGSDYSLAANLIGSKKRLTAALRCDSLPELEMRIRAELSRSRALKNTTSYVDSAQSGLNSALDLDVTLLPTIRSWPGEKGGYLTLALAVTKHPLTGEENVGLYRSQVLSAKRIALNFAPGSGADKHYQAASKINQPLPVALFLGSDPALLWAAAAPLPENISEFSFCEALFAREFRFIHCLSQPLAVPADAELVIEGQLLPGATCEEGPFGNHTGQYVTRKDCPLMTVTAMLQKSDPLIPMTVVGPPPSENIYLGKANEILIRELLKQSYPQIQNVKMPLETIFHGASLLTVYSEKSSGNRELIDNLWNDSPLKKAKILVLFDEDIDLNSFSACWWRAINKLDTGRIYQDNGRLAIDATGVDPATLVMENQQTIDLLQQRSREYNL